MTTFDKLSSTPPFDLTASKLSENGVATSKGRVYAFSSAIEAAVDVAIGLGRPLLVAGEPGCGKTELGYAVARRLGLDTLYYFSTKSSSEARDLFYTYDAVGRFREAQLAANATPEQRAASRDASAGDFVQYQALGRAILDAHGAEIVKAKGMLEGKGHAPVATTARQCVVIVDEIDKAPRDFTNDMLREIEDLSFRVPELGNAATPPGAAIPAELKPIIIVTSNEESQMPDAFLRRCVFLAIEFPKKDQLRTILDLHFRQDSGDGSGAGALGDSDKDILLTFFDKLREPPGMQKNPGIAELIDAGRVLAARPDGVKATDWLPKLAPALVKLKSDRSVFASSLGALQPAASAAG